MRISNIIKRLQHIQDNEGDLVMYKLDEGIPKKVENVEIIRSADVCILSL